MLFRFVTRLQAAAKSQRRTISEYAKSFGYKVRKSEIPEPGISPLKIVLCYGGAAILMYDVMKDRKEHYQTFIEHRQEGKEYLKTLPYFNRFTPMTFPPVDRFLNQDVPEYDIKKPNDFSTTVADSAAHLAMKENPEDWKKDTTSYIKN